MTLKVSGNFLIVSLLTIVVSFCSIVYELIYSQTLTVIYGNTVARYSMTIGLYLLSLGAGAFFYHSMKIKTKPAFFWWNELILSLVGPLGVMFLFLLSAWSLSFEIPVRTPALLLSHIPIVVVGVLSGFELPILVDLLNTEEQDRFSRILGLDYIGSFVGTVVYALLLYPEFGLIVTALWVGFLNLATTVIYSFSKLFAKSLFKVIGLVFLLLYLVLLFFSDNIQSGLLDIYRGEEIKQIHTRLDRRVKSVDVKESFFTWYQDVVLYDITYENGESDYCLNLDSNIQMCDSWHESYHEGLVDIPMLFMGDRQADVLVLGGGDWIATNSLLQYPNVARIDHVDIDKKFFEFMKNHPYYEKYHEHAYANEKVNTVEDDAFNFLRYNRKKYDLILVDIPGITHDKLAHLYSVEFYHSMVRSLKEDGIVVMWDYLATGALRKHYQVLMNTLNDAGFKYHVVYSQTERAVGAGEKPFSQPFYILGKQRSIKPDLRVNAIGRMIQQGEFEVSLSWIKIPYFQGVRENTIIQPNYDIIVH